MYDIYMDKYYLFFLVIIIFMIYLIYLKYENIQIWIMNRIIINRGIFSLNRFWYEISDIVLSDGAGIKLYNNLKLKYGDFAPTYMFNKKIYVVTNNDYIKIILNNSPDIFNVGDLKNTFFKSIMNKNVGVSSGCPWKSRRIMNETALNTDTLHKYSEKYNNDLHNELLKWKNKDNYDYDNFNKLGKKMATKIIFNTDHVHEDIFNIFREVNTTEVFSNPDFKINPKIYDNYIKTLNYYIDNPNPKSLVDLCLTVSNNKDEVLQQIPHFIFPLSGLFITSLPRLLIFIFNHKNVLEKVINEVNSIKKNTELITDKIYNLTYVRQCIMETLRLINPLVTTFRSLSQDFTFDEKYSFKKGTQFLILNNPVLREKEYFEQPGKFIPERWTPEMEKSYYAISFNQGPQRCPAKELVIFLLQSFIDNFFTIKNINMDTIVEINGLDMDNIPQITNPFSFYINIKN